MRLTTSVPAAFAWPRHRWSTDGLVDAFAEFDRLIDGVLGSAAERPAAFVPTCDVSETADHYLVSFDVPGLKPGDVKVEVRDQRLVVSGERRREAADRDDRIGLRMERAHGKFERSFTLPTTVALDRIEAHFENGVLNVAVPKVEAVHSRTVEVQTGQGAGLLGKILGGKKDAAQDARSVRVS